jgi:ATP-binding cassette subfamily F protein 3
MGEKSRVALARLILAGANFLVLDEPTNYLDIYAKEKNEAVLEQYEGGILFVSHDIYFVQRIAAKIMLIELGFPWCMEQKGM